MARAAKTADARAPARRHESDHVAPPSTAFGARAAPVTTTVHAPRRRSTLAPPKALSAHAVHIMRAALTPGGAACREAVAKR